MDRPSLSRRQFVVSGLAATTALAGCALPGPEETERSDRTVEAPPDTPLVVENQNGDVTVSDGATDAIDLEITKRTNFGRDRLADVTVETDATGDRVTVETVARDLPAGVSVSVDLRLYLPDDVPVERVRTRNGDVRVEDVSGDATLATTNGRVSADGVDGFLTLQSTNGSIETRDVGGLDGARTTNGSIDVEVPAIRGDTTLQTTNGEVRLAVATDLDAFVDLQTTNGDVGYSGLDLQIDTDRSTRLRGTLGDGGSRLVAKTINGDVRLRPL